MSEQAESFFASMSRAAGIGIVATDDHLMVQFCNPAAEVLLGRPASELIGRHLIGIVPPERTDLAERLLERILQSGESSEFQFRYCRPEGGILHLAVTVSAVTDEDRVLGMAVFLRDISRQMSLLRDVAQTQKMAALESMAGAVAHHFNNIVGGAITTADFALASDDSELHKRTLGITVAVLSRANELTHGLLAFAEGEHTDVLNVSIPQTLERYVSSLAPRLKSLNIELAAKIEPVGGIAPPKGLTVVLDQLIANALEAMPGGGTLTIDLGRDGTGDILLRIADTGSGISEHVLPRVFEPFFTTKQPERAGPADHPGLGLAVVYGVVKDLGGTVDVTSSPDHGTCFTIRLPPEHTPIQP